jgi:hypothetical protein
MLNHSFKRFERAGESMKEMKKETNDGPHVIKTQIWDPSLSKETAFASFHLSHLTSLIHHASNKTLKNKKIKYVYFLKSCF